MRVAWAPVMLVAMCVLAVAQAQMGTVRVNVRVEGASRPLSGARVTLSSAPASVRSGTLVALPDNEEDLLTYLRALAASRSSEPPSTAITDADGNAVFRALVPGVYNVAASRDGYVGNRSNPTSGTVTVTANQPSSVFLVLYRGASIRGVVRDTNGNPLVYALVTASAIETQNNHLVMMEGQGALTTTGADGKFRLTAIGPGDYVLAVTATTLGTKVFYPGVIDLDKATVISVKAGQELVGIGIEMPR